jgi:hypothetical protein
MDGRQGHKQIVGDITLGQIVAMRDVTIQLRLVAGFRRGEWNGRSIGEDADTITGAGFARLPSRRGFLGKSGDGTHSAGILAEDDSMILHCLVPFG